MKSRPASLQILRQYVPHARWRPPVLNYMTNCELRADHRTTPGKRFRRSLADCGNLRRRAAGNPGPKPVRAGFGETASCRSAVQRLLVSVTQFGW